MQLGCLDRLVWQDKADQNVRNKLLNTTNYAQNVAPSVW